MRRLLIPVLTALSLVTSLNAWQRINLGRLEIRLTPVASEYCHVIRFPKGWSVPRQDKNGQALLFDYASKYEFRVEGVLGTQFLVGGYTRLGQRYYTLERYKVDLSDPAAPIVAASKSSWDAAAVVPLIEKSIFPPVGTATGEAIDFHGFPFAKSGEFWVQPASDASRLSPDQAWVVLQSAERDRPGRSTKVFFDVFSADTGKMMFTLIGSYSAAYGSYDVDGYLAGAAWMTERYFIIPLGQHKERCLVCEFGKRPAQ